MVIATIFRCVPILLGSFQLILGLFHWSLWLLFGVIIGVIFTVVGKMLSSVLQNGWRRIVCRRDPSSAGEKPVILNLTGVFDDSGSGYKVEYISDEASSSAASVGNGVPLVGGSDSVSRNKNPSPAPYFVSETEPDQSNDQDSLVQRILSEGRSAMLLRPTIALTLSNESFEAARNELLRSTSLIPEGEVLLDPFADWPEYDIAPAARFSSRTVRVDPVFIDRYPVTNLQYYVFVAGGGYRQATLWEPAVLPAVLDFVDRTGRLGPRFWNDGCYLPGEENRPVVGISWYEAAAYSRWAGKRLPSDAEWVKAACWPIPDESGGMTQRRYPWGDVLQAEHANLWGSGPGNIVDVDQYPDGDSVAGVHGMIGNVWEWTSGAFRGGYQGPAILADGLLRMNQKGAKKKRAGKSTEKHASETAITSENMSIKTIRGGAFDTYFINQATCQFESGEPPLSRRHNIGFRTVIAVADLMLNRREDLIRVPVGTPAADQEIRSEPGLPSEPELPPVDMPVGTEASEGSGVNASAGGPPIDDVSGQSQSVDSKSQSADHWNDSTIQEAIR